MIKNLPRQLNEAGKIKIGKKGKMITSKGGVEFRPPEKLNHFQLVTTEKDDKGDYIVDVDLQNKIKKSKNCLLDKDGCLIGLPIRLLYNDSELNFPNRLVSYVSGKLNCTGDGEYAQKRIDAFEKDHSCPCERSKSGYDGKDMCKPSGTLTCVLDEAGLFGQAHKFRTTSINTITGILGGIELIKTATNGRIAGLPLMLTMNQKNTVTPGGIATTIYIVSICYRGDMSALRQEVIQMLSTDKQFLLDMDTVEKEMKADMEELDFKPLDDDEEREFVEEFFPNAIDKNIKQVEAKTDDTDQYVKLIEAGEDKEMEKSIVREESEEANSFPTAAKPINEYKGIYDRLVAEKDFAKAFALAKRLRRENLLFWLSEHYHDIAVDPKIKKSDLLNIIEGVLASILKADKEQEESRTVEVDAEETSEQGVRDESSRKWDEGRVIRTEQLRALVGLKSELEASGVLHPDKWEAHVNFFLDKDGGKISKAVHLTEKQGNNFIKMLKKYSKKEE